MSKSINHNYLLTSQYKDSSNLNSRIQLHESFSTNKYGWFRWVFDQFNLSPKSNILELGCGTGLLWVKNINRIPEGWDITLSDFSPGMLNEAQNNLCESHRKFRFTIIDAQSIPFQEGTFDTVIANHMLYDVLDRPKVFSEIHRVLKSSGHFYATTNGRKHLRELIELVERVDPYAYKTIGHSEFNLENGSDQLSQWFSKVELYLYKDSLVVTEVKPLFAYIQSTKRLSNNKLTEFKKIIEKEIALNGAIYITKSSGIFKALKS